MQINVVVTATADDKDSLFRGEVRISDATFSYELHFVVPIECYMDALRGKTTDEFRKAITIQIRSGGEDLELNNDEWRLFYYLLMPSIVKIH